MRSHDVAWVGELLLLLPEVEVRNVRIETDWVTVGEGTNVPVLVMNVWAATPEDAAVLVESLGLTEAPELGWISDSGNQFTYWLGWVADASAQIPVSVVVDVCESVAGRTPNRVAA